MPDIHAIRLRGPWDYEPLARITLAADGTLIESADNLPPVGKQQMPADWGAALGPEFCGRVRYRRRFGCPTGVEPHEKIWLVFDRVEPGGSISLNGEPLGWVRADAQGRFEVTNRLAERNELVVEISTTPDRNATAAAPGGLVGEVRLEIVFDPSA